MAVLVVEVWMEVVVVVVVVGVRLMVWFEGLGALGAVLLALRAVLGAAPGVAAPLCPGPRCPAVRGWVWGVVGVSGGPGGGGSAGGGGGGDAFESGVVIELLQGTHAVLLRREHRDGHLAGLLR